MQASSDTKRITNGFLLSLIAGILVLINGALWFMLMGFVPMVYDPVMPVMAINIVFLILGSIGILFAIAIFIGTAFIYQYGNKSTGGKIVVVFSAFSIGTGGGFGVGMIIGILGGYYGIKKK